ncbi:MAG: aminotransferase class IV [Gemmatimonadota bacterium]
MSREKSAQRRESSLEQARTLSMHESRMDEDRKTWTSAPEPPGGPSSSASRSLRYGDGVFVTMAVRDGVVLDVRRQLARLRRAAGHIGLRPPAPFVDRDEAPFALGAVLETLGGGPTSDATARVQWSAGPGPRGFGRDEMEAEAIVDLSAAPAARRPAVVRLPEAESPLPALPRWKTCSALAQVQCERAARARGADTGVRTRDGLALETGSANLFWLADGRLFTPAAELPLYAGSVRERVIECASDAGLSVDEGEFGAGELDRADAVVLTNGARGLEFAASLDGRGLPEPSEVLHLLAEAVLARRALDGVLLGDPGKSAMHDVEDADAPS